MSREIWMSLERIEKIKSDKSEVPQFRSVVYRANGLKPKELGLYRGMFTLNGFSEKFHELIEPIMKKLEEEHREPLNFAIFDRTEYPNGRTGWIVYVYSPRQELARFKTD